VEGVKNDSSNCGRGMLWLCWFIDIMNIIIHDVYVPLLCAGFKKMTSSPGLRDWGHRIDNSPIGCCRCVAHGRLIK